MKQDFPQLGIEMLTGLFGKTRHAYYDYTWRKEDIILRNELIIQLVQEIRISLPRVGVRKLHHMLAANLHEHCITIGRDQLFDLLDEYNLLVRNRRRRAITTNSKHWMRKYANLIIGIEINRPDQLWVSDITYVRIINGFAYLILITDAYSRKIVGYMVQKDLSGRGCIEALQMALNQRQSIHKPLIHHSDRGSQYCSKDYVGLLNQNSIAISMTENGDPYENAIAERVNGILKSEFKIDDRLAGFEEVVSRIVTSIHAYNHLRPHASCNYLTPLEAHCQTGVLEKRWRKSFRQPITNP